MPRPTHPRPSTFPQLEDARLEAALRALASRAPCASLGAREGGFESLLIAWRAHKGDGDLRPAGKDDGGLRLSRGGYARMAETCGYRVGGTQG